MYLKDILVLVTGGTDGIGLALARRLYDEGSNIIVCGRSETKLSAAGNMGFETIAADLSTSSGCDALLARLAGQPIDLLVNNAGTMVMADIAAGAPVEPFERELFLNFSAPLRLITGLLPGLKTRPEAMIVNVTSGLALSPKAAAPVYCASKAALRSFSKALRAQLAETNVKVLEALPPMVDTAMTAGRGNPRTKLTPEACARQIVEGIKADRQNVYVGMTKLLVALQRIVPGVAERIMLRM